MRKGLLAVLLASCARAAVTEVTPVLSGTLAGGQYFFEGQKGNVGGNAALNAAALLKYSDKWSGLPMYSGSYQGTKGVDDSVGAGTLFQQQMSHRLSYTGIRRLGESWRLKPSTSYRREFIKETRDERWGKGLFDYEKIAAGLETENVYREPFAWRMGLDVYRIRFPNYQSLESMSGIDPFGNPLNRELAPTRVLDTRNAQATLSGSRPFPYQDPVYVLQGSVSALYQTYEDQKIVNVQGQFDNKDRRDLQQTLSASVGRPVKIKFFDQDARLDLAFALNAAYHKSNQNTYDSTFARFVPDAYSYMLLGASPSSRVSWGDAKQPNWLSAGFRWSRQAYLGRLAQDAAGLYTSAKQRQDRYSLSLGAGYPIAPKMTMTFKLNFLWAASNHAYERTYSYTYRAMNYLLGVTYEY